MRKQIYPLLITLILSACGTTDKVLEQNDPRSLTDMSLRSRAGDATTDPININPKTMLAMPGSTGNDLEDYSTTLESRLHGPIAGDVFSAALWGGASQAFDPEKSPFLAELRVFATSMQAAWVSASNDPESTPEDVAAALANWKDSLTAIKTYEAELRAGAKESLAAAVGGNVPNSYTYMPIKFAIANAADQLTTQKVIKELARVLAAKRGETFNDPEVETEDVE